MSERRSRRRGAGREAAPQRPSLAARGASYRPLDAGDAARIAEAALTILAEIGMSEAPGAVVSAITAAGGSHEGGRLLFPRALVERVIRDTPRPVLLCGQLPEHDLTVGGDRGYVGTGGAAPNLLDLDAGRYRPSTLADLHDAARMADALGNIQFFSRSLVARDVEDPAAFDMNTAFAALAGTAKHVMVSASDPDHVPRIAALCHRIAGSEAAFRERPFLSLNVNHVVPPLRFHAESALVMAAAVRHGIPVHANVFGQLGASSPVTLAGSVAQTLAETLAGLAFAHLVDPEARVVCGPRAMITDLRTGGFSGGSGEQALATAMCCQVLRLWDLPCSVIAGATDSKLPDAQAGYEKAMTVVTALLAGANLVTQACGMQAGLMGVSHEAYVIDSDMLGAVLRACVPPEVSDATLALDSIRAVTGGEGHFLGQAETYARMKSDFLYPEIADRRSIEEWQQAGAPDLMARASERARAILAGHRPSHIAGATLRAIIREHGLQLQPEWPAGPDG